ncbi:hypothetical protein [Streptococcus respiraculi]|uniref:hypothetical protein n=1 Tax=Streptococcus respiraculi TaxID=2021971 RepID=UPI0013C44E8B|nr:hypothetical protein [Streptococcus respiraculi]
MEFKINKYSLLTVLFYFTMTSIFFLLSLEKNMGVSFALFGKGDDSLVYWSFLQNKLEGLPYIKTSIYVDFIGFFIQITGFNSPYFVRMLNIVALATLILYSNRLVRLQSASETAVKFSNMILMFYASLLTIVTLGIYRDVWIYLFFMMTVYYSYDVLSTRRVASLVMLAVSFYFLFGFRGYAAFSAVLGMCVYLFFKHVTNYRRLLLLAIGLFAIYYTFFKHFEIAGFSLTNALEYRNLNMTEFSGGSNLNIRLDVENIFVFLFNYAQSYLYNLLSPFPWQIKGLGTLLVFVTEFFFMVAMLFYIYKRKSSISQLGKYTLIQAFVWNMMIAFTNDNIGTASRLRVISWILIIGVFVSLYDKEQKTIRLNNYNEAI